MKVSDLILEVRVFQNNFVRIGIIEKELEKLFDTSDEPPEISGQPSNIPTVDFDKDGSGMYIIMNNATLRKFENLDGLNKFTLTDTGIVDEDNNTKYYIEYIEPPEEEEKVEDGSEEA